jgi:hypothetical protein
LLHLLCWGIPAAFMATALGMKKIQYEFANLCLVSLESIFNLFFYPMAAIVIPSFVLHMCTFMYIAKVRPPNQPTNDQRPWLIFLIGRSLYEKASNPICPSPHPTIPWDERNVLCGINMSSRPCISNGAPCSWPSLHV